MGLDGVRSFKSLCPLDRLHVEQLPSVGSTQ